MSAVASSFALSMNHPLTEVNPFSMAIQLYDTDAPPVPSPPVRPKYVLFVISMKRLSALCLLASGCSTGILLAHFLFFGLARLVPAFDPQSALTSVSLRQTWYIGVITAYLILVPQFLWFFVPFAMRYEACAVEGTLAPANALRKSWTPAFCTPGVRHSWAGQTGMAVAFAGASMLYTLCEDRSDVLDPFHAGVLGVLGTHWVQWGFSQWQLLRQIEREDEGDGVWRMDEVRA